MRRKAFSLMELLISAALFCAIASVMIFGLLAFVRARTAVLTRLDGLGSVRYSVFRITSDVKAATEIKPSSTTSRLVLGSGSEEVSYDLKDGKVRRFVGTSFYLTEAGRVDRLEFSYPGTGLVRIEIGHGGRLFTAEAMKRN